MKISKANLGYSALFSLTLSTLLIVDLVIYNFYGPALINERFFLGTSEGNTLAIVVSVVFLTILSLLRSNSSRRLLFVIIAAASLSNVIDRLLYGGAIDYFKISALPLFNLSDIIIVIGLIMFFGQKVVNIKKS